MKLTRQIIEIDEGCRSERYIDSVGHPSIGIGHNLDAAPPCDKAKAIQANAGLPPDNNWLPETIDAQYEYDLAANCGWLWAKVWWSNCSPQRQAALNDMGFNLGPDTFQKFHTFLGLVAAGDWKAAADDLINHTAVYHQLPGRYGRIAKILETGNWPW